MADKDYPKFKFSVTCHSTDLAVVHCLRALAQWAEQHPYPQIGWGGSGEKEWQGSSGTFVLRFTDEQYRRTFIDKGTELLPQRWKVISTDDANPAIRRRPKH
jgi:hypothetical protein